SFVLALSSISPFTPKYELDIRREKRDGDPEVYRSLQTSGSLPERRVTRSGFDVPGRVTVLPVCHAGSLFFFCFVGIFQMLEGLLADNMLHPTGVPFRRFR